MEDTCHFSVIKVVFTYVMNLGPPNTITIVKCNSSVILDEKCLFNGHFLKLSAVILVRVKIACHHCSVAESGKVDNVKTYKRS